MDRKYHEASCVLFLGEPWTEVHAWLDAEFATYGSAHRPLRHNPEGVEACVQMFGEKARCAAKLHLYDDHELFNYYDVVTGKLLITTPDMSPEEILMARIRAIEDEETFEDL